VDIEGGVVKLTLQGARFGCPSPLMTLKTGIESVLIDDIPQKKEVVAR
jgi:Fe-S cluster biogenesis protein NfuA